MKSDLEARRAVTYAEGEQFAKVRRFARSDQDDPD